MWPLRSTPLVVTLAQSFCSHSWQRCCDSELYGPQGDVSCWRDGRTYENCCGAGRTEAHETGSEDEPFVAEDFMSASVSCWREGYNFKFCCVRDRPGGNADCWDETFTYERCCKPPVPREAGTLLEDFDGLRGASRQLARLLKDLKTLVVILSLREFHERVKDGGAALRSRLRRAFVLYAGAPRLAFAVAELLLCLLESDSCHQSWRRLIQALRDDDLNLIRWSALSWPIPELFRHLVRLVGPSTHVQRPACREVTELDWPLLWEAAQGLPESVESDAVLRLLFDMDKISLLQLVNHDCVGGVLFTAMIKLGFCMDTTPDCVISYLTLWRVSLESATQSIESLKDWLAEASSWNLFELHVGTVDSHMRHRHNLALSFEDYASLGALGARDAGCVALADARKAPWAEHFIDSAPGLTAARAHEKCRSLCGKSQGDGGRSWSSHALLPLREEGLLRGYPCLCSGYGEGRPGNCSAPGLVQLRAMPRRSAALVGGVLSQAEALLPHLSTEAPVFVTMVFGKMAQHLEPFSRRVRDLGMPNVVVFALDAWTMHTCLASPGVQCVSGTERTALQKYEIVLVFLSLGRDTFWFDFDSVWLKNPVPFIEAAKAADAAEAMQSGRPPAMVFSAIDFYSKNCAMNAYFLIRPSQGPAAAWVLSLLDWIYSRPYVHDQLAFSLFLGSTPLVDDEPIPAVPAWAPLDPNVFANAARFEGLGFSAEVEDLAFFHFFDGWNSNSPDGVEFFAKPTYKGLDMFSALYADKETAAEIISRSRLPPPATLKDCSHMVDLGLGVAKSQVWISV